MIKIDEKDGIILDILQKNCRTPLVQIARKVGLSVDSVKKRMNKMVNGYVYYPRIQLRPRNFGFPNVAEIRMKVHYNDEKELLAFIESLKKNHRVVEIFSIAGDYDLFIVVVAKDAIDLGRVMDGIRNRFGKIITAWSVSLTIKCYKFEEYDVDRLFGDLRD